MKLNKKIVLVVSMAIMTLSVFLSDLQVNAANTYYANYPEPMTDTNSGYCIVEVKDSAGTCYVNVYFWYMIFMKSFEDVNNMPTECGMQINVTKDSITFTPIAHPSYSYGAYNLMMYNGSGILRNRTSQDTGSIQPYVYNYKNQENLTITGISYKGNIIKCTGVDYTYTNPFVVFNSSESALALQQILNVLLQMDTRDGQQYAFLQTYIPKMNEMLLRLTHMDLDFDDLLEFTQEIIIELETANETLSSIDSSTYHTMMELQSLHNTIKNQSSADKNTTDGFKQDSDSQSNQLNNLNQQSQPDKIDVNNASGVVDQNLNINTDANYGVLLSTFTSNGKILTMLLAVSSIGLISYVLFGKR